MTTLVTGAAGFAGSHLLELLVREHRGGAARGPIVAWHRGGPHQLDAFDGLVAWECIDVLARDAVRAAIARLRPSTVYHFAGMAHVGRAWERVEATFATNVRGTHHVLDALAREKVDARVLIPSSALVYEPVDRPLREDDPLVPSSPYGLSKLAQELLAHHAGAGVTVTIARAFNHIGPRQSPDFAASGFARQIAEIERDPAGDTITVGNLEARRDVTDVRDTVRAYRLIVDQGRSGEAFNICSSQAISIRELLDRMIARARVPVRVVVDPARYRPNDAPLLVGDATRLRSGLGWKPQIPIDRTLDDLLEYWRRDTA